MISRHRRQHFIIISVFYYCIPGTKSRILRTRSDITPRRKLNHLSASVRFNASGCVTLASAGHSLYSEGGGSAGPWAISAVRGDPGHYKIFGPPTLTLNMNVEL